MTVPLRDQIERLGRAAVLGLLALPMASCATPPPPVVPTVSYEQKVAWILWLEDQRILRDPAPAPAVVPPVDAGRRRPAVTPQPLPEPDLIKLAADPDARVRRRTALALGRVGLSDGLGALRTLLADTDAEVRQAAAFGSGLLGDVAAADSLVAAVSGDADVRVRAAGADALGLLADRHQTFDGAAAVKAIGDLVSAQVAAAAAVAPDELGSPLAPEVEAFRRGLYALVRLKGYDAAAQAVLDAQGQSRVRWWPVAYALQRLENPRAVPALLSLLRGEGVYAAAFAARGLGAMKDPRAVEPLIVAATKDTRPAVRLRAVESLGRLGDARACAPLLALLDQPSLPPALRIAIVTTLGQVKAADAFEVLLDLLSDPSPLMRIATQRALVAIDPMGFVNVLSGMDIDPDWTVRAALAETLASIEGHVPQQRILAALDDTDQRTLPAVLRALVRAKAPGVDKTLVEKLKSDESTIRETAARLLAEINAPNAVPALVAAFDAAAAEPTSDVREAALSALVSLKAPEAKAIATRALADPDWAVRLRARAALATLDPAAAAEPQRPAPIRLDRPTYDALAAPKVSPHVFIETPKGNIEIELAVLDAPVTSHNFMTLARKGYFNGVRIHRVVPDFVVQDGDPRGDGTGSPGYSIRDELNDLPYLRGTVGMALSGPDTGGSQFFITHSPQPHLDGKYTVFGRVVSGMEVVDRLQQGDAIDRIRVWDGVAMTTR